MKFRYLLIKTKNKGGKMKKFFAVMAIIILSLAMVGQVWAVDATEARNPEAQPMLMYGKSTNGNIAKFSAEPTKMYTTGQKQVCNMPCRLYTVTFYSDTAGDLVGIWDIPSINNDQWLEFEIAIAANTSSTTVNFNGVKFENGLYISSTDPTNSRIGVVYDY